MENKSIFQNNGDIFIIKKANKITWLDILQTARYTNSMQGGWNSKTFWQVRGLEMFIAKSNWIENWTKNTLEDWKNKSRESNFRIKERNIFLDKGISRGVEHSENILNWQLSSIIKQNNTEGDLCVTYELPLRKESLEQFKIDVAIFDKLSHSINIVEIKKAENTSDSPLLALVEEICYLLQLTLCLKHIKQEIGEYEINILNIILAAPYKYWNYWIKEEESKEVYIKFNKIIENVNKVLSQNKIYDNIKLTLSIVAINEDEYSKIQTLFSSNDSISPLVKYIAK